MSRNLKKIAIMIATVLLIVGSLPFMSLTAQAADANGNDKITIGTIKNTAAMPAVMAKDATDFSRNNVNADVKTYDSNKELNDAIANGEVNFATTDLVSFASIAKKNSTWKIVGTLPGYYGLVANKKIKNLKGKTIAIDKKSGSKQYLKSILKKNKVKYSSVKVKQIDADSARVDSLKSGDIDAAVLEDPSISNAIGNGAKVLNRQKTGKDNGQVLIANKDFTKKNASSTQILVSVLNTEIKNINKMGGYGAAQAALRDFGINDKGAKYITDMSITFKKVHKVKKSDFKKAFKFAKSQKNFKGKISYKKYTLKVKGVK
ncbi:MAG TPA: transporter substrate-binding domain-containing protein [Companilactobacillus farciminis]|uniref:Transporter substrate-binding domain-containing protein n=1 Tax=Companilactobacillus farciminis TaxID=1612 RepID=A0A921L9F9_9LACO|nr:transporter substrate-binding domain-containing protein [Companilactobacillus farciminis]